MVAVIAVGIAIDGTIHLLSHYNELCRTTSDYEGAVQQAVQEVATPLIVSSLALSPGFRYSAAIEFHYRGLSSAHWQH